MNNLTMNEKVKAILEYSITKVRENQIEDCEGNRFVADTGKQYICYKLERYMNVHDIKVKGVTVEFLYDLVGKYYAEFEPIRRMAIGTHERGNDCAVRIWCLLVCKDLRFRDLAQAVGSLYVNKKEIKLPAIRAQLRAMCKEMSLADIKFFLMIMKATGVLKEQEDGRVFANEWKPANQEQYDLVDKTFFSLKKYVDEEKEDRLLMMFPFFPLDNLMSIYGGDDDEEYIVDEV